MTAPITPQDRSARAERHKPADIRTAVAALAAMGMGANDISELLKLSLEAVRRLVGDRR